MCLCTPVESLLMPEQNSRTVLCSLLLNETANKDSIISRDCKYRYNEPLIVIRQLKLKLGHLLGKLHFIC